MTVEIIAKIEALPGGLGSLSRSDSLSLEVSEKASWMLTLELGTEG